MKAYFNITYYAKKHGGFITRSGKQDNKTKEWTSKNGTKCFTYYDLDNMGYRTAVGDYLITPKGYN
jgi:hypothetical protein